MYICLFAVIINNDNKSQLNNKNLFAALTFKIKKKKL